MCVVSMVGDHFQQKWEQPNYQQIWGNLNQVSRTEFDSLKKEVEDMKKLLERAVEYDKKNNESNCETEDKIKLLKEITNLMGVDLSNIFD
jgi:hypothetical protein